MSYYLDKPVYLKWNNILLGKMPQCNGYWAIEVSVDYWKYQQCHNAHVVAPEVLWHTLFETTVHLLFGLHFFQFSYKIKYPVASYSSGLLSLG